MNRDTRFSGFKNRLSTSHKFTLTIRLDSDARFTLGTASFSCFDAILFCHLIIYGTRNPRESSDCTQMQVTWQTPNLPITPTVVVVARPTPTNKWFTFASGIAKDRMKERKKGWRLEWSEGAGNRNRNLASGGREGGREILGMGLVRVRRFARPNRNNRRSRNQLWLKLKAMSIGWRDVG